jgi:hypothetical protein
MTEISGPERGISVMRSYICQYNEQCWLVGLHFVVGLLQTSARVSLRVQ